MTTAIGIVEAKGHFEPGHPESPSRLEAIVDLLDRNGILEQTELVEPNGATVQQLTDVHSSSLIDLVRSRSLRGDRHLDADTYITTSSYDLARQAAGTACVLSDTVMLRQARNAFALVRPPGHHAESRRVGGFCLFNNIAITARHLQRTHGLKRIAIIDFDVHHGNGTQEIFYADPDILFISMHLFQPYFYPGSGSLQEIGRGDGRGATVNIPFPPGVGDRSYSRVMAEVVIPICRKFRPQFILASAGFDAHWIDPLASAGLSITGYTKLARDIFALASDLCSGRCVFVLEGGYHSEALAFSVLNVLRVLKQDLNIADPLGPSPYREPDIDSLINKVLNLHLQT